MQKRIFRSFAGLMLVSILALAVLFGVIFRTVSQQRDIDALVANANGLAALLNHSADYTALYAASTRVTLIAPNGDTRFDNLRTAGLHNRSNRPEFIAARTYGSGSATRASDTLGADTFYHAIRLESGYVLRLSQTLSSLGDVFPAYLPDIIIIALAILLVAYLLAHWLTRSIVRPLLKVDFDDPASVGYEELWPFIRKINHQKLEIEAQIDAVQNRTNTIEAITANMREGLIIVDAQGRILTLNNSVCQIFSLPDGHELLNQSIQYIYRDAAFNAAVKDCLQGNPAEHPFTLAGRHYIAILNPAPHADATGAIIFFLDITEAHKAEALRREFSATVSHELKTPLAAISSLSEMLANGMAKPGDTQNFAAKINTQAARLLLIIDDIMRLSAFDEQKIGKDFAPVKLHALAQSVIANLQGHAHAIGVTLKLNGPPAEIPGDRRLIEEMLTNLLENAIKYNRENGTVTLTLHEEADTVRITVADTGIGIDPAHHARLFERFYRADASRSKQTGGTGLGLSIVKHIVEHHGGSVRLESTPDVGTTIEVTLRS